MLSRRTILKQAVAAAACSSFLDLASVVHAAESAGVPIATQQYPWGTFYGRSGKDARDLSAMLAEVKLCGLFAFEPIATSPEHIQAVATQAKAIGLEVPSIYVNSSLYEADEAKRSIDSVLAIAAAAKEACGTRIVVTNPSPLAWGGKDDKSDLQLRTQASALDTLGAALSENGQQLAYHNHDAELRSGARELHHMLASTNPNHEKFCLDAHWIFRGCGDSEVAVFDVARLYASRVIELHLRQSHGGVWSESFAAGDIDYSKLAELLAGLESPPLLVLEQAVEGKSPQTMSAAEAHTLGRRYAQQTFSQWASS
ncbi:TIM barrel protein [Bremerella sp. JC817]|uniref:sugar phosphate isomerase/epimerase family protein n=1 Tax=Bremerella sp. JC817 TaxID=3231756 RepID=UPI003457722C